MLSAKQKQKFKGAIKQALQILARSEPMTAVEHADANFYMSPESSYIEGKWKTVPYQIAILNAMGNDEIEEVNWKKSARVGYTKLICAVICYFIEHKKRNVMCWNPDDGSRDDFSKLHIDTMIRDVPVLRSLFPWFDKKHKKNNIDTKIFTNLRQLILKGGKAAKNFREKSVDVGIYDELSKFDRDIEKEGTATFLGDKRLEGSVFRKSIRGSTPTIRGDCQIEEACSEAAHYFKRFVPCPHCNEYQVLEFGGKGVDYGIWWDEDVSDTKKPKTVKYICRHCKDKFSYIDYLDADFSGYWESDSGLRTGDGIVFTDTDEVIVETPLSIAFHIWSAYSAFSPWSRIVKDVLKIKGNKTKLKTFVNTTLGEEWEEEEVEKIESDVLYARREHYLSEVPVENCIITASVDTQDDRFEIEWVAWVAGEENYRLSYERLYGDLSRSGIWKTLHKRLSRQFATPSGTLLDTILITIDSGGHYSDEVYNFSKRYGLTKFIPIRGSSTPGSPIAKYPRKRNPKLGVYLTLIGTDTAKELITTRFKIQEPGEGYTHWPINDEFDEDYYVQLTNEVCYWKIVKGKRVRFWDAKGKRNEPFDTSVYNLAAIRILQQHFGYNLANYTNTEKEDDFIEVVKPINKPIPIDNYLGLEGDWL